MQKTTAPHHSDSVPSARHLMGPTACSWRIVFPKFTVEFTSACILIFGLTFGAPQFALAEFTLEDLINEKIAVVEIIKAKVTLEKLIEDFQKRPGLSKSEITSFFKDKKNRRKIKELEAQEKELIRELKRKSTRAKNKCFYGSPEDAEDATLKQLTDYAIILEHASLLFSAGKITESTYQKSNEVIEDLKYLHLNNKKITEEYSQSSLSETYGTRTAVHPEGKDVEFQLKAGILFDILKKAYLFASSNQLLSEFFSDGLSKVNGCLEARLSTLAKWHEDREVYFDSLSKLSEEDQKKRLPDTGKVLIEKLIEGNYSDYYDLAENRTTREKTIRKIHEYFKDKTDISGNTISYQLVKDTFKGAFLLSSSPTESPHRSPHATPRRSSPTRAPKNEVNTTYWLKDPLAQTVNLPVFEKINTPSSVARTLTD
jgi:hypothetical protein